MLKRLSFLLALFCVLAVHVVHAGVVALPAAIPGRWETIGRTEVSTGPETVTIANGYLADFKPLQDCEMTFRAQAPKSASQVQIWAAVRVKDRDSRYVFALRGGAEPEISLARYAPDGNAKFLGYAPLDFTPEPGQWYTLRAVVVGNRFQIYLGDEKQPRINAEDKNALWTEGGVGLGGGWLPTEFASLTVAHPSASDLAAFSATGTTAWQPPATAGQRAASGPVSIPRLPAVRGEFSLDGNWLLLPDQDIPAGVQPAAPGTSDRDWHVVTVPSFWTPTLGWLHGEFSMPGLTGLSASAGPSDKLVAEEYARVNAQGFDWKKTKAAWYRRHLVLPQNLQGKEFHLVFDAIAKVAEVWVNGKEVGSHTGMFGQVDVDVTNALHPGDNVIAVHDTGIVNNQLKDANAVEGEAVTVTVTNQMLRSLPHGMADASSGGIWQPVKLVVTDRVHVSDVFIRTALDGLKAEVEIANNNAQTQNVQLSYSIYDAASGSLFAAGVAPASAVIAAGSGANLVLSTPKLSPKLWSPATPNLYWMIVTLKGGGVTLDQQATRFGFRTFAVEGGKLMLNGKPYWLRGGDHFPVTLRPNDSALAHRFIQLAREGNVRVTRSHAIPFTSTWFDAADELGMGVSYEGTWPWLMLTGEPPSPDLLKVWKDEYSSLLREYRNRPSLLFWTVNNEMKFEFSEKLGPEVLKQKWAILSDMIQTMRQIDPTRPIVPDSSYTRRDADKISKAIREENHFDDGDIDDAHRYYGTYEQSFFHLFDGQFGKKSATPGRPLISQEMSTGYPRNDDWPSRTYEFPRYVPQAIAGDYAFEQNDPSIYMTRQAFMTKELAEVLRRTDRDDANGIMHFAYLTWFTDVWKANNIKPKLTYYELQKALQPVLVSAELYGRHCYAGEKVTRRVCIVNDSDNAQPVAAGRLVWEIRAAGQILSNGAVPFPAVPYYTNQWRDVDFEMPATLPEPRVDAALSLSLESGGKIISQNSYDLVIAKPAWSAVEPALASRLQVFDPHGSGGTLTSLDSLDPQKLLVVGDSRALLLLPVGAAKLRSFVQSGGRALLLQPGADLVTLFPDMVKAYRKTIGEIVTMQIPESPVFDGIEPLDTAWFEMGGRNIPYACSGTYEIDRSKAGVATLAQECDLHPDIRKGGFFKSAGYPIVELRLGKGVALASEMMLSARDRDPIAGRLLRNMIHYLIEP